MKKIIIIAFFCGIVFSGFNLLLNLPVFATSNNNQNNNNNNHDQNNDDNKKEDDKKKKNDDREENDHEDEHDDENDNPCPTAQPTPTRVPCPTAQPTVTPIPSVTPTQIPEPTPTPTDTPSENNDNGGDGNGENPGAPVCNNSTPADPNLTSLIIMGNGQVKLQWDSVTNATHYSIVYGPNSGDYQYGVANTGNSTNFTIGSLGSGNYCFAIRAVNDCAPSGLSNEMCTNQVSGTGTGGAVLGASTLGATGEGFNLFKISSFEAEKVIDLTRFNSYLSPTDIKISSLGLNLSVTLGKINNSNWDISETGATYLAGSGVIGDKGNAVIYGHNENNLMGPIRWVKPGTVIEVKNAQGESFRYEVTETTIVNPDQIEVLKQSSDSRITLYTCTGYMDQQRFVVVAKLK